MIMSGKFYPIDMVDYTESFNKFTGDEQKELLSVLDVRFNNCRELI